MKEEFSAAHCTFDPDTGTKTYDCPKKCAFAFNAQYRAYLVGAAPAPIAQLNRFSYITEIADTGFFMENLKPGVFYNKMFPELHRKLVPIFRGSPYASGPEGVDLARHNLGLYKGKVVMIDFC
jgi:hypothetical protein